ncbi:MAG: hypothetical protein ACR2IL_11945 [Chitinophagaceae bacterium]
MLEQLVSLLQSEGRGAIIENPAIPNERNDEAMGLAAETVMGGLKNALSNGQLNDVVGLFTGNSDVNSNPVAQGLSSDLAGSMMSKFGLDAQGAGSMASQLIPGLLSKLSQRTNDPNDSGFDINNMLGSLMGASASGGKINIPGMAQGIDFSSLLKGANLDANGDGKIDMNDLSGMVSKLTSGNGAQGGLGGAMDMLKGLFGK